MPQKKSFFKTLFLVSIFALTSYSCCGRYRELNSIPNNVSKVNRSLKSTVAFIKLRPVESSANNTNGLLYTPPYCAGFFISSKIIISAAHCFQEIMEVLVENHIVRIPITTNLIGDKVLFSRYQEITDSGRIVKRHPQEAKIIYQNFDNDFVMLRISQNVTP